MFIFNPLIYRYIKFIIRGFFIENFRDYLNEVEKIVLKPFEPNWRKDYNLDNCEGKLHHWDDNYFNLYKVADPNDAFSETKISNPIFDRIFLLILYYIRN